MLFSAVLCYVMLLSGSFGLPKPWYFPVTSSYWCAMESHGLTDCLSRHQELSVMHEDHDAAAAAAASLSQPLIGQFTSRDLGQSSLSL